MSNFSFNLNRRQALKFSAGTLLATLVSPIVFGQTANPTTASSTTVQGASKIDGVVSYNAGWVINLEDKAPLLEIEAKKNKEQEDLAKQKAGKATDSPAQVKDKPKSLTDKMQDFVAKIKGYF
jgi:hypothetical protein